MGWLDQVLAGMRGIPPDGAILGSGAVDTVPAFGGPPPMVGRIPLPRPRPDAAPDGESDTTDISAQAKIPTNAAPTAGQMPFAPPAPPSFGDRLGQGINDNAPLLLALAGGFGGAASFGEGMRRAFSNAAPIAQAKQEEQSKLQNLQLNANQVGAALLAKGVPQADVAAAVKSPELLKALVGQYYGKEKFTPTIGATDRFGQSTHGAFNPQTGEWKPFEAATAAASAAEAGQNQTARALLAKGAPAEDVAAATRNPELMKALVGQYYGTKDKYSVVQTGEDQHGRKTYQLLNSADGSVKEIKARNLDGATNASLTTPQTQDNGEELDGNKPLPSSATPVQGVWLDDNPLIAEFNKTNPGYAKIVKATVNGDLALPTGRQAQTPYGRKLIEDVLSVDGGTSEADFKTRAGIRKSYTSGIDSRVSKSINTTIRHGQELLDSINTLDNFSYFPKEANAMRNTVAGRINPEYQKKRADAEVNLENYVRELDFAISGGRPTVSGAAHQREAFDINGSPEGQKAALRKSLMLLKDRLEEHQKGRDKGMVPGSQASPILDQERAAFLDNFIANPDGRGGKATKGTTSGGIPWSVN